MLNNKLKIRLFLWVPKDEVEELQYWCGDATGHEPEEEGMSQRTLRRSKWEEGFEERESVVIGEVSRLE